jgi:hypothetical protein
MNDKRDLPIGRIDFCHSGSSGGGTIFPGPGNVCRCAEKDKRIAELEAEIARLKGLNMISARTLLSLVGKIREYWSQLFPTVDWRDPETAVACIANELAALRAEKQSWVDAAAKLQRLREADPDYARVMY